MSITRIHSNHRASRIVIHKDTVYLCGQTAAAEDRDVAEQTRLCLEQTEALLTEAGSDADHILSVTVYLKSMEDFAAMNAVWDGWFADREKPARACVQAEMARPIVLVELSVIAAVREG